uniref:G_PROTEIN_RECEP_F1_2 domain-containing protein n=1 Tax=Rhabditophanes sp. KR3021 TaxID=114890 RepID=A0AC35UI01_9BILA
MNAIPNNSEFYHSYMYWVRYLHQYSNYGASIIGFTLNIFLFYFLINVRNKDFAVYRRILLHTTISDVFFCPTVTLKLIEVVIFCSGYTLSKKEYTIFTFTIVGWNFIGYGLWYWAYIATTQQDYVNSRNVLDSSFFYDVDGSEMAFLTFSPLTVSGALGLGHSLLTVTIVMGVVVYTFVQIQTALKQKEAQMSKKSRILQKQLSKAMIIHAMTPAFICFLPVAILILACFFRFRLGGAGILFFFTFEYVAAINSVICFVFVTPIRMELYKLFGIKRVSSMNATTVMMTVSSNVRQPSNINMIRT